METLPAELLEQVVARLGLEDLAAVTRASPRLQQAAVRPILSWLAGQDWSVRRTVLGEAALTPSLASRLLWRASRALPLAWHRPAPAPALHTAVLGEFGPGEAGRRVCETALWRDKLYLGLQSGLVTVFCLATNRLLHSLERTGERTGAGQEAGRGALLTLQGDTLVVASAGRDRVRVFNCRTDLLCGEIETRMGPVYSLALAPRLLVCLSGWSILAWRVHTEKPDAVRGQFQAALPDLQPSPEFQNWLEVHTALINSDWLVTRATRLRAAPTPGQARAVSFLHCRRVGPDGWVGELSDYSGRLGEEVVEVAQLVLSPSSQLAMLSMLRQGEGEVPTALQYQLTVRDLWTGTVTASLPPTSILASVVTPLAWAGDRLWVRTVPASPASSHQFSLSLAAWDTVAGGLHSVPGVRLSSSSDLVMLEQARVVVVSTRLGSYIVQREEEEEFEEDQNEEDGPRFTIRLETWDFWQLTDPDLK